MVEIFIFSIFGAKKLKKRKKVKNLAKKRFFKFASKCWRSVLFPDLAGFLLKNLFLAIKGCETLQLGVIFGLLGVKPLFLAVKPYNYGKLVFIYENKKKASFFGNKTFDQHFGANLKKHFFAKFGTKFVPFLHFFSLLAPKALKMKISTSVFGVQYLKATLHS